MFRALLAISLLLPAAVGADPAEVHLTGDASISADILRETDDAVYLDLGFDVLRVPRDAVTGLITPESVTGEASSPAVQGTSEIDDFHEDLDLIRRAIVLVSTPSGFGAGFVVDPSGLVLTNHHVVRQDKYHRVTFYNPDGEGTEVIDDVELIAFSRLHDIALLQLPEESLPEEPLVALSLAPNESAEVGDPCFAIGNPGMGRTILSQSVGQGIISSLERSFNDILYLQTTAPVNPGNSGGPLIDDSGQVIGLITYKAYLENVGFGLPVHEIRRFLEHRTAYLADDRNPNTGYRYLSPVAQEIEDEEN